MGFNTAFKGLKSNFWSYKRRGWKNKNAYCAGVWRDLLVLDAAQDGRFDLFVHETLPSFYIHLLSFLFLITRLNYIICNASGTHSQVTVQAGNLCSFFSSLETRGTNFSPFIFSMYVGPLDRTENSELLKGY